MKRVLFLLIIFFAIQFSFSEDIFKLIPNPYELNTHIELLNNDQMKMFINNLVYERNIDQKNNFIEILNSMSKEEHIKLIMEVINKSLENFSFSETIVENQKWLSNFSTESTHTGAILKYPATSIKSPINGKIKEVGFNDSLNRYIVIYDRKSKTEIVFGNLEDSKYHNRDKIKIGDILGTLRSDKEVYIIVKHNDFYINPKLLFNTRISDKILVKQFFTPNGIPYKFHINSYVKIYPNKYAVNYYKKIFSRLNNNINNFKSKVREFAKLSENSKFQYIGNIYELDDNFLSPIYGTIIYADYYRDKKTIIKIKSDNGILLTICNIGKLYVRKGDSVTPGKVICSGLNLEGTENSIFVTLQIDEFYLNPDILID